MPHNVIVRPLLIPTSPPHSLTLYPLQECLMINLKYNTQINILLLLSFLLPRGIAIIEILESFFWIFRKIHKHWLIRLTKAIPSAKTAVMLGYQA